MITSSEKLRNSLLRFIGCLSRLVISHGALPEILRINVLGQVWTLSIFSTLHLHFVFMYLFLIALGSL